MRRQNKYWKIFQPCIFISGAESKDLKEHGEWKSNTRDKWEYVYDIDLDKGSLKIPVLIVSISFWGSLKYLL